MRALVRRRSFCPIIPAGPRQQRISFALSLAAILLVAAFATHSYNQRTDIRDAQVAGCARAVADRLADVERDEEIATLGSDNPQIRTARIRTRIAEVRERLVSCADSYPAPSPVPFVGG